MFTIDFTDEPVEYPYDDLDVPAAPGRLILGKCEEGFLANLAIWNKQDYESHWAAELRSIFDGQQKVALVVSFDDPLRASNMETWIAYRDGDWVHFQRQLLLYEYLPKGFEISELCHHIEDRSVITPSGNRISERDVHFRDIELYLHRSGRL